VKDSMSTYQNTTNPGIKVRVANPLISLIVPVFNEEQSLAMFMDAVVNKLAGLRLEIIFIDDGSTDNTLVFLRQISATNNYVQVIKLSRNFGKEAALTAGINLCNGDVAIPVDVDLQDPLEIIHDFISKWQEGFDVVHGIRNDRQNDGFLKRYSASKYYQIFNFISDLKMTPHAGDFRLLDRKAINALRELPERVRFMKGLFTWIGFSTAEVHYRRLKRTQGKSKFNFKQLFRFGLDGVISFSSMPIRVWSVVGMMMTIPAIVFMFYIIIKTLLMGVDVPGYASIVSIVLFIGGIQFLTLGFIGEYVGRIFTEVKGRPIYIIEETISAPAKTDD
jgi:glycosyltransferase involved in cell wall biosynthesis